jgi:mannose-6-phosphate isomerase-like protein (cupin superfamily)
MDWYEHYGARHGDDGAEGRLVSEYTFSEDWPSWEMHPNGAEVVICIQGAILLHQEFPDGTRKSLALRAGEYAINPPGVWHIADVKECATAIFITAGEGTQHRPR